MKGDFTRRTFKPEKHYSSVQMQQGRVQLDSDWNEEVAIIDHRWRATLEDTIGRNGVPKTGGGFELSALTDPSRPQDLMLTPGRLYVDGILCQIDAPYLWATVVDPSTLSVTGAQAGETRLAPDGWVEVAGPNGTIGLARIASMTDPPQGSAQFTVVLTSLGGSLPAPGTAVRVTPVVTYLTQPDLPNPPAIDMSTSGGYQGKTYLAYLDVFERHLTAIDDPPIREVALNGPDSGTRTRTTWQLRLEEVADMATCADFLVAVGPNPAGGPFAPPVASTGRLRARAVPTSNPVEDCLLPAEAGYRRLENQLYRVEVHHPGDFNTATFKWSRDNGSVAVSWLGVPKAGELQVVGTPQDSSQGFDSAPWVELTDDARELSPDGAVLGTFIRLTGVKGDVLTYDKSLATVDFKDYKGDHPKVRRWESDPTKVSTVGSDGWTALEDGVEVQFLDEATTWFNKGDYWLIPARTSTTNVEWPNDPADVPVALRPHGIEHRYCALAVVQVHLQGLLTILDCRPQFPPLTAIAASDVSYDNSNCLLVNSTTVQEALDALCKARDLSHHNRLMHGYGIVCGLQVHCGTKPGMWVTVKEGYAVDCDGKDIEISDTEVDVGQLVSQIAPSPLDGNGDGDVSLMIGLDQNAQVKITGETYQPPASEVDAIFGGTLLLDYYQDCIRPLQQFIAKETGYVLKGDPPISAGQELTSAFVDLLAQGPNPQSGQNVLISRKEHELLLQFYEDLRNRLHSDTFCALLAKARPYPKQPVKTSIVHGFGSGQQTRIKARPNSTEFFTMGNGSDPTKVKPLISRYTADGRLVAHMDPTKGASLGRIVDFAFSADGNRIYVILEPSPGSPDTNFVTGSIGASSVTWLTSTTILGLRLAAVEGYGPGPTGRVAAAAIGKGLRVFTVDAAGVPTLQTDQQSSFNASGHLAMQPISLALGQVQLHGLAFACTCNFASTAPPPAYDGVHVTLIGQIGNAPRLVSWEFRLPAGGASDGLVWGPTLGELYVVDGGASKSILGYRAQVSATAPLTVSMVQVMDVPVDATAIRMGVTAKPARLYWTSRDFYTLNAIDLDKHQAMPDWWPMQVGPVDIAVGGDSTVAVLNRPADSVLFVPQSVLLGKEPGLTVDAVKYHQQAVEAYVDLLAALVQHLKDCFCDHLLVSCAECNPRNQKLYLGVVSIRGGSLYRVCNFSGRHYLKTFPTVGYWMSLLPIVPLIGAIVARLCCLVVPELAAMYKSQTYNHPATGSAAEWSLDGLFNTMQDVANLDVRSQLGGLLQKVGIAGNVLAMGAGFNRQPASTSSGAGVVIGTRTDSAIGALAEMGMRGTARPYTPSLAPQTFGTIAEIFRPPVDPSNPVTLYESGGQVVFTGNPSPPASTATMEQQLQAKDQQLQQMQAQLDTMNAQLTDLHSFRTQVTQQIARMSGGPGAGGPAPGL
jgi:Family of unknown function (DUF6519)